MNSYASDGQVAKKALRLCLCAFPWATEPGRAHSLTSARILRAVTDSLWVIARLKAGEMGDGAVKIYSLRPAMHLKESRRPLWVSVPKWLMNYLAIQVEMSQHLMRVANQIDAVVFGEGPHYILPVITAKLRGKKIIKYSPATVAALSHYRGLSLERLASFILRILEGLVLALSDRILVPPWKSSSDIRMVRPRQKISSMAICSCVREEFSERKSWHERDDVVGYVGGLTEAEGALQLTRAIPLIVREKNVRFLIVGSGILMNEMKRHLAEAGCLQRVEFIGRVPSQMLPHYLNEMKVHILPSFYDFTGAINLEAMACGTVVLANNVGGIPNIVADGKTGFLMGDNRPEIIARKLIQVWDHPGLEQIRQDGKVFAEEFSYRKVVAAWGHLLKELNGSGRLGSH